MRSLLAQNIKIGEETVKGPLVGIATIGDVINVILLYLIPLAGVILLLVLIWGGYDFLLSGGNPEKVKKGKAKITTALIGFLLLVGSFFIVRVISSILDLGEGLFK